MSVAEQKFDFGDVDRGVKLSHAFRLTNVGKGVLKLKTGRTSCTACTIAGLEKPELAPGESTELIVKYSPPPRGKFEQTATVLTSDPQFPQIQLAIKGTVVPRFLVAPDFFDFGNVISGEGGTAQTLLLHFHPGELRVVKHEFGNRDTADLFSFETQPLPPEEVQQYKAQSGLRLVLALKPGLPLGTFRQTIRLDLQSEPGGEHYEDQCLIVGMIVSDMSIVGVDWLPGPATLDFGNVSSEKGATRNLRVLVRGPDREKVEIEPLEVDPPGLRVTVGKRSRLGENVEQIPLTVEIPAGMPSTVRRGNNQGPFGEILLGVKNHSKIKEFRMRVRLIVD